MTQKRKRAEPQTGPTRESQAENVAQVLRHLKMTIYMSPISQAEIEKRLHFSRGHLSQILNGAVELKWWQLLAILSCLDLDPGDFFAELFPRRRHRVIEILDDQEKNLRKQGKEIPAALAQLFSYGLETVADFRQRLAALEDAIEAYAELTGLDPSEILDEGIDPQKMLIETS